MLATQTANITVTNTATDLLTLMRVALGDASYLMSSEDVVTLASPIDAATAILYKRDGDAPTTTEGEVLAIGQEKTLYSTAANRYQLITESGTQEIVVTVGTWSRDTPNDTVTGANSGLGNPDNPINTQSPNYAVLVREDSVDTNIEYVGYAAIGSLSSAAVWQIKRVDITTGTTIDWADGNDNFDNIYDNRESLSYS